MAAHFLILPLLMINAAAQKVSISQPTVWATKPDVAGFEKIENEHLEAAQHSIDALVAALWRHSTKPSARLTPLLTWQD